MEVHAAFLHLAFQTKEQHFLQIHRELAAKFHRSFLGYYERSLFERIDVEDFGLGIGQRQIGVEGCLILGLVRQIERAGVTAARNPLLPLWRFPQPPR